MIQQIELTLPFPPSVNTYWRHVDKGNYVQTLISADGRKFKKLASDAARRQFMAMACAAFRSPVSVKIRFYPPDKRVRDLDNYLKALLDAITEAGIWVDDSLVHELVLAWGGVRQGGSTFVSIHEIENRANGQMSLL